MTVLILRDGDWTIQTPSWSIGGEAEGDTTVAYAWARDGSPEAYAVKIGKPVEQVSAFIRANSADGWCDLRGLQEECPPENED